ncbi:unnamed protein product [Peniophora sp. CBMAI 1063]|nr:unnamed protein product [Peniophora sp. CBMAI 1063]
MPTKVIFVDSDGFELAAYDADDGLSKQMALRFTARGGKLCESVEEASYVIINQDKGDWRGAFRTYVSDDRIALATGWIDACIDAGRALLEDDQFGGFRLRPHDTPPASEHRTPLPTPRTTPTSSAPPNMPPNSHSPQYQPTPGHSASPSGQQPTPVFPQAGPPGGYYQGQTPMTAGFPHQFSQHTLLQGLMNHIQQSGNAAGQPAFVSYSQPQPSYQQQPNPGQSQNPYPMPQASLHPHFLAQYSEQLLQNINMQQVHAAQIQQELQTFDLNNPFVVDTLVAVAQHQNNVAALQLLQTIRAFHPQMPATPMLASSPPMHSAHMSYSPVEDDAPAPSTRKRKSEQMAADGGDASEPRKVAKRPSIAGASKDKGKQKAVPSTRPNGPSSRKVSSSTDLRGEASGSGSKPAVKQEKDRIFKKKNGEPLSVYVLEGLWGSKSRVILAAVKAHGGTLIGAGRLEEADFCVMDRSNSKDAKKLLDMASKADVTMVNAEFVPKCVEKGRLLRYTDFPSPLNVVSGSESKRVGRPSHSFFTEEKPRKGQKDDFLDDDEDSEDSEDTSDDEPVPRKRPRTRTSEKRPDNITATTSSRSKGRTASGGGASSSTPVRSSKGITTVKSAKEQSAVKQPKLIPKPKSPAQVVPKPPPAKVAQKFAVEKAASKPDVASAAERDSPNPPPPEKFDGKRYKFTDEEMEWAWNKLARMAQQDEFLSLAKACEGLAKKTPHHSASSWRGKLERDLDRFEEIRAEANPSRTGAHPPVSSAGSAMPPKLRVNSSGSSTQVEAASESATSASAVATAQAVQLDESNQSSQSNSASASSQAAPTGELPAIRSDEGDDLEMAISFLIHYEPSKQVEIPGDETIWPVLARTLAPCKSQPSWQEFWEKYESNVLQGVQERVASGNTAAGPPNIV